MTRAQQSTLAALERDLHASANDVRLRGSTVLAHVAGRAITIAADGYGVSV